MKAVKLSQRDFEILAACDTEADLSIATIAKRVGSPEHVVRRVLKLLNERGVIHRRAYMNSFLVGTIPYLLGFALNPEGRKRRKELVAYLAGKPQVSYIANVSGRFNIFTEVRFVSVHEIQTFLDELSLECGNIFSEKEVLSLTAMYDFPVLARASQRPKLREFATNVSDSSVQLSAVDMKILEELAKSWSEPNTGIARRLGMPSSNFDYHLKRLRSEGVLLGARYFIDLFSLGLHTFYHVVSMKGYHPTLRERMIHFARREECVHCLMVFLGAWDFILLCNYQNTSQSIEFVERLVDTHAADIAHVDSYAVLSLDKISDCTIVMKSSGSSL